VADERKQTLIGIIRGRVCIESVIDSANWPAYDGLVDVGYEKHFLHPFSATYSTVFINFLLLTTTFPREK
jgi:hypothetical protein